jgi:hypothetical protein
VREGEVILLDANKTTGSAAYLEADSSKPSGGGRRTGSTRISPV